MYLNSALIDTCNNAHPPPPPPPYTRTHAHTHTHARARAHACTHTTNTHAHTHMLTYTCSHIHVCTCMYLQCFEDVKGIPVINCNFVPIADIESKEPNSLIGACVCMCMCLSVSVCACTSVHQSTYCTCANSSCDTEHHSILSQPNYTLYVFNPRCNWHLQDYR